tara:strand:+ start:254 stop:1420 length:1167 start_codon:yes stop_codon:yes gene_type:complete
LGWSIAQQYGLTFHRSQLSYKGYTLVSPHSGDSVFLIDLQGRFVHRWKFNNLLPRKVELLENGNLLVLGLDPALVPQSPARDSEPEPFEQRIRRLGANCSLLVEVNWAGEVQWSHEELSFHHDFKRLANGHTIFPVWVELSKDLTDGVQGGVQLPHEDQAPMLGDDIVEIDTHGKEVRRVETWKLFDPVNDPICPLEGRAEWTHVNSVDVNDTGDILFSSRNNSRVAVIDGDGVMSWKFGSPNTSHQHHATWLRNGNIQIFDNGMHRRLGMPTSRVIEVNPASEDVVWSYEGHPAAQFFSGHISGAIRLQNGNTLICEGTSGRVFEITDKGEPVWEWWNPIFNPSTNNGELMGFLFRAYRYGVDYEGLAGQNLDPLKLEDLNRLYGLL